MRKPFKSKEEERTYWDTKNLGAPKRPRDSHSTRNKGWTVNAYLSAEQGLTLEAFAGRAGMTKTDVIREALDRYIGEESKSRGWDERDAKETYLKGIDIPQLGGRVKLIDFQFYSDNPNRDIDLARKLKSVLLIAFPGAHVIGYARNTKSKGIENRFIKDSIASETDVRGEKDGDLTPEETERVKKAVKKIAHKTIGQELVSRHQVAPRRLAATG